MARPILGERNIRNLPSLVEAGIITQAQADKLKKKALAKGKKSRSILKRDS